MPFASDSRTGQRVAYYRKVARLTQKELAAAASIHIGTLRKVEQGTRGASDGVLEALAAVMGIDVMLLLADRAPAGSYLRQALPALSAAIATYDLPDDGPTRPLHQLRAEVSDATVWRLAAQYTQICRSLPQLLMELFRTLHGCPSEGKAATAGHLIAACRSADAVAYKIGAYDLSARLIDLMRWAAAQAGDRVLDSTVAYIRTETFLAAHAYGRGLSALETAIGLAAPPLEELATAVLGALHMRAAVVAGRMGDVDKADTHLTEARTLGARVPEGVYAGTAFGPSSVRIHEVSVAVSLGAEHVHRALAMARHWAPPRDLPGERRSGYYIELARAQLWSGMAADAFESLRAARRIAPQHVRDHPWVREDAGTLRRLRRGDAETLNSFAEWCHAI